MLVALGFTLRAVEHPARFCAASACWSASWWRRAPGGAQYALGVPEALVSLHVLGAALVTVGAAALWAGTAERPRGATAEPSAAELVPAGA